ncbi:Ig-like domain-containing protein [Metabacillus halosaccharovorans]|uniref:Ig-like domain-containing protein n=1 Tax=Metabacillus halosaccharovorans TaxID=930124 RepID=A0ABT3DNS2_9BACI|nr:Ig-like domain-containing protein [Metabacillus halosaccharovorans]MCV9888716.1 Ig-like domain-containing protein [Metabacillus halosaccharovorans]
MYSKTRDFYTFTEPEVYIDLGYSVIDTTMIEHDDKIYRLSKDERGNTSSSPNGKFIFQEVGNSVLDPNFELIKEGIGKGSIGQSEGPTIFKSNTEEKWYMFIDEFGGRGYVPFETTDLQSGEWKVSENYDLPARPRHGTVLPVTKAEHEALLKTVPTVKVPSAEQHPTSVTLDQEAVTLSEGKTGTLHATVTPNDAVNKAVVWSSNNEEVATVDENGKVTALKEGKAKITVTTVDGGLMAVSEVTVEKPKDTTPPVIEFNGYQETYTVDSNIKITCNITDDLSGIASKECENIEGPAYEFELGINKFTATATDKAGNTAIAEIEFTVTVDFDSLGRLTETMVTKEGIADALVKKLQAAKASAAKGNQQAMNGQLNAYENQLKAQTGKSISEENSKLLIDLVKKLKG